MLTNHWLKYYGTLRRGWIYYWWSNDNDGQSLQTNNCGVPRKPKNVKIAVIKYKPNNYHTYKYYTDIDDVYYI